MKTPLKAGIHVVKRSAKDTGSMEPKKIIGDLFKSVEQYRQASSAVESIDAFMPKVQIRGLLIELAFKTYLAAFGEYREGHDLVKLCEECESHGLTITDEDREHVIDPLQKRYCFDYELKWKYPSRYAMEDRPTVMWITPGHANVDDLVRRVIVEANSKRAAESTTSARPGGSGADGFGMTG